MEVTGEKIGGASPWVARITGTHPKYKLNREFVNGVRDYSCSNSKGTRGIVTVWLLEDGIYEVSLPQSWNQTRREFIEIVGEEMKQLSTAEVIKRQEGK